MHIHEQDQHRRCVEALLGDFGEVDARGLELARLLITVANQCEAAAADALRANDLSAPRFVLLIRLLGEELYGARSAGVSPTDLSRYQQVSKNTISALLRGLEEHGLIERTLDSEDHRAFRIRISPAGRAVVAATAPAHLAFMNELMTDLSADERTQLALILGKLHASLLRRGVAPRPADALADKGSDRAMMPSPDGLVR